MTANYVLLAKNVVGAAGASAVTFSNIPQTGYTDLIIRFSTRDTDAGTASHFGVIFNGDTGANYTTRFVRGDGSGSILTFGQTPSYIVASYQSAAGSTSNAFGTGEMYIPNYTSSNQKSVSLESISETNNALAYMNMTAATWSGTSAITSITLKQTIGGTFVPYSTFYLYGVAALGTTPAIVPYATGGDTIMTDGTYWYHAFRSSGTFTPAKGLSCDVLVVAGGGGGGADRAGGGGAGGYRSATSLSLTTTGYSVTVGAGGAGAPGPAAANGSKGNNSVFSTITSTGGGFGAGAATGGAGGSGGGAFGQSNYNGGAGNEGGFSPVEGYAGGNSLQSGNIFSSGGGGGAGGVGGNAVSNASPGAGGIGSNAHSSWASVTGTGVSGYYAGGGGGAGDSSPSSPINGGAGGAGGGGGGGATNTAGTSGTANTGGGGGGGGNISAKGGGAGGSGIVIVRYAV